MRRKRKRCLVFLLTAAAVIAMSGRHLGGSEPSRTKNGSDAVKISHLRVREVNCFKVVSGDPGEVKFAARVSQRRRSSAFAIGKCSEYVRRQRFVTSSLSSAEVDFPIAYSILVYRDVDHFQALLRAIYRPQNVYCVHVDAKSTDLHAMIAQIADCFGNVFLASRRTNVAWGYFTVLQPELTCMKDLLTYRHWKYFINLTGQEFPLKTNLELVEILKNLNNKSLISWSKKEMKNVMWRAEWKHPETWHPRLVQVKSARCDRLLRRFNLTKRYPIMCGTGLTNAPPPEHVQLAKGPVHVVLSRSVVDASVSMPDVQLFVHWLRSVKHASEHFFSSLAASPQLAVPTLNASADEVAREVPAIRYKIWQDQPHARCGGQFQRTVCVLGVSDVAVLAQAHHLFANKFQQNVQPMALRCLEEWLRNRTIDLASGSRTFSGDAYVRNFLANSVA